jgi:hypothetical protein
MKHVTTKRRELAPALMARVDACAYIFMADKPEKIKAIAEGRGVTELEAGRIYTIGALKAAKRRGTAKNYREALDMLEAEQVGDRGNPLTRTVSADNTARTIARMKKGISPGHYADRTIYRDTGEKDKHGEPVVQYAGTISEYIQGARNNAPMRINRVDVIRMAWAHMDNQLLTAYVQTRNWRMEDEKPEEAKRSHALNTGKVLGTLYTEWEAREMDADPGNAVAYGGIEKNLRVFFAEYISRLSRTVKMRLADLADYIDRESNSDAVKAEKVISALTSAKGRKSPGTSKLANFAVNLHRNFEHKDSVTCPELISMLFRYGSAE